MKYVIDKDKGLREIVLQAKKLKNTVLVVGVLEGEKNSEGANIAEYATYNEFGTKDIPPRPFMSTAFDKNQPRYSKHMEAMMSETSAAVFAKMVNLLGLTAQQDVLKEIDEKFDPPNSPATIAKKKSDKPLIDTGAMRSAITYEVRNGV